MTVENKSGIVPVEYKVLIRPDPVEKEIKVSGTESSLWLPDETHEREGWAQIKGTLIGRGEKAFEDWGPGERRALIPGARVYFNKYDGVRVEGADGEEYLLMADKSVAAIITAEAAAPVSGLHGRRKGGMAAA